MKVSVLDYDFLSYFPRGQNWQLDSATSKTGSSKQCGDVFGSSQHPGVSIDSKPGKKQ